MNSNRFIAALVLSACLFFLASCGGPGKGGKNPDSASEPGKKSELPVKDVTGSVNETTVTTEDKNHVRLAYVIRSKESQVKIGERGPESGVMHDVNGEIKREDKVVSTYKAPTATIDRKNQTLLLSGGVTVTSESQDVPAGKIQKQSERLALKAANVKYDQGQDRIEADGNVTVTSDTRVMGPLPKLWASPDLNKIATPGKFKMKRSATILVSLASAGILASQQNGPQLHDNKQRFALWFLEASREAIDKASFKLDVSGNPFHGYSKDQNLEFSATNFNGVIKNTTSGVMLLKNGTLSGSVTLVITDSNGTSTLKTSKATIDDNGETATLEVPGSFTMTNSHTGEKGDRSMTFTATRGTFTLKSLSTKDENPLISGHVSGPLEIHVDEKGPKGKSGVYTMSGQNLTITSQGADKLMNLVGKVHASGDETSEKGDMTFGTWDVDELAALVDSEFNVKKISTKGSPGTATLRDKKGGG